LAWGEAWEEWVAGWVEEDLVPLDPVNIFPILEVVPRVMSVPLPIFLLLSGAKRCNYRRRTNHVSTGARLGDASRGTHVILFMKSVLMEAREN